MPAERAMYEYRASGAEQVWSRSWQAQRAQRAQQLLCMQEAPPAAPTLNAGGGRRGRGGRCAGGAKARGAGSASHWHVAWVENPR